MKLFSTIPALCGLVLSAGTVSSSAQGTAPLPPAIALWTEDVKQEQRVAGEKLLQDIAAAVQTGQKSFMVPQGDYRFQKTTTQANRQVFILLRNLNNFVLDGNGSTFWFEDAHQAVYVGGSRNLTIKNLYMDWDPLPYTQGTVVAVHPADGTVEVRLDPGYGRVSPRMAGLQPDQNEPNVRGAVFEAQTGRFKRSQNGFRVMPFLGAAAANGIYTVKILTFYDRDMSSINAAVGDRMAFWIRADGGFLLEGCENVTLEDITLYSCAGFGFRDAGGEGPVTFRRCNIFPRPGTNRLLGGNSDGFHSANMEHGPLIEGCTLRSLGDDGVNVHGYFYNVAQVEGPTTFITDQIAWRGDLENVTLNFYRKGTYAALGQRVAATVKSIRWNEKNMRRVELTAPIAVEPGDMFSCENFVGQGAVIRDNSFSNLWPRGILFRSTNGRIENNKFEWIGAHALALYPQPESWRESAYIHDLVVDGNTVTDACVFTGADGRDIPPAGIYLYTPGFKEGNRQENVEIRDNVIVRPGGDGILARGAENLRVIGNRVSQVGNLRPGQAVALEAVEGAVQEKNTAGN